MSGLQLVVGAYIVLVQVNVAGTDRQRATLWHRVAGVHHQVHQYLLHLAGINLDQPRIGAKLGPQANVFADQPLHELLEVHHQCVQCKHARLQHGLAAERQQLARQVGGALARPVNLLNQRC